MDHATFFLSQPQYDWLANALPEPVSKTKQVIPNNELLNGILFVLKTGCRWEDIPASVCRHHYSSCWRRLRFWQRHGYLKVGWQHVLLLLDREGQIDLSLGNLDGTLVQAPRFAGVGYDSKAFRKHLRARGIGTNIPERKSKHRRKRGRKPHMNKVQFKFRAFVERTNAWMKSYHRLRYRYERKRGMFQAVVDLCCLLICLRRVGVLQWVHRMPGHSLRSAHCILKSFLKPHTSFLRKSRASLNCSLFALRYDLPNLML